MDNRCAWCKVDVDTQPVFSADNIQDKCCPLCGAYNDIGQKTISINNMKQIYDGAVSLMSMMVDEFRGILDYAGVDYDDLLDGDEDKLEISFYTNKIVKELFLSHTRNSGGTSTGNLVGRLGIKKDSEDFLVFDREDDEDD